MNHTLETINQVSIITFDATATNHLDAREGSALAMVNYANENYIGGFDDWILPSNESLLDVCQLLDKEDNWYWSSSPYVGSSNGAWVVSFYYGYANHGYNRYGSYYVRLVRSSQLFDIGQLSLNKRFGAIKGVQR